MTGQPRDFRVILEERLTLIQRIASANSEHLRLNQIASGMMILDQKDEVEGADEDMRSDERDANDTAIDQCRRQIEALEAQLVVLDRELAKATER